MAGPCFIVKLPLELLQEVGHNLERDSDVVHFAITCREVHDAIEKDCGSFWRRRFMTVFDKPEFTDHEDRAKQNHKYRRLYAARQTLLYSEVRYANGIETAEEKSLYILQDMFVQSFAKGPGDRSTNSKNLEFLQKFVDRHNIHVPFAPKVRRWQGKWNGHTSYETTKHLLLVQCLFAPSVLLHKTEDHAGLVYGLNESQQAVYSTREDRPFFGGCGGCEVDLELVIHHLNFWKYYLCNDTLEVLFGGFELLPEHERPQYFTSKLVNGSANLGGRWKGTYAFLPSAALDRVRYESQRVYQDEFPGEDDAQPFQDLDLRLTNENDHFWPELFESHVGALNLPHPQIKTRAQRKALQEGEIIEPMSFRFKGHGSDQQDDFLASGWINTLPSQMDVPGWQRMTMMKYYLDKDTGAINDNSLWAYEGVVLPGGKIIVGRWWRAEVGSTEFYSGPFILWCIDS